jgi:hypothetical protein
MDLATECWPFAQGQLGGIVSVNFLMPALFRQFESSLSTGVCLLIETVPAHGGNFIELPNEGELRRAFADAFQFEFFKEKKPDLSVAGRLPSGCSLNEWRQLDATETRGKAERDAGRACQNSIMNRSAKSVSTGGVVAACVNWTIVK